MVARVLTIPTGKPLPVHPRYEDEAKARAFWRLSFHTGRKYVDGIDATGLPVIPAHEREREGYARRKQLTKPRNHAGPIIRRYNDHVFRRPAQRDTDTKDEVYRLLLTDADGKGTTLPEFMKRTLLKAQIEREAYIMPDTTAPADGAPLTVAQAQAKGVRPFLRRLGADAVVWWRDYDGMMVECLVLLEREDGTEFARWYGAKEYVEITFKLGDNGKPDKQRTVEAVTPPAAHGYDGCPIVRVRPLFTDDDSEADCGEAQIAPMAYSQQMIANFLSLLTEETFNITFTQYVALGVSAEQVGNTMVGNNRLLCIPNPQGSIDKIGADPAQADSIRTSIMDEQRELYRIAGVDAGSSTDGGGQAESGLAKAFKHNDLAANLAALALASQSSENLAVRRVFAALKRTLPKPAGYPTDFDLPQLADELNETIRGLVTTQLPAVLRRKLAQRFATRNFELSQDEKAELQIALDAMNDEQPEADPPAGPPRRT